MYPISYFLTCGYPPAPAVNKMSRSVDGGATVLVMVKQTNPRNPVLYGQLRSIVRASFLMMIIQVSVDDVLQFYLIT